jgi:hypothetical protein
LFLATFFGTDKSVPFQNNPFPFFKCDCPEEALGAIRKGRLMV